MHSGPTRLTRRGWSLLGAGLGLIVAGRLLGADELTTLGLAALLLIAGCVLHTRTRRLPIGLQRVVRPDRVPVNADARVDLEVRAGGPTPPLAFTDAFDGGRRAARFLVPALDRGESARAAYRVPTDRRGRFTVGPAHVGIGDPFGLTLRSGTITAEAEIIVRPRVVELRGLVPAPGHHRSATSTRSPVPVPSPAHDEFLALREYAVGDDLRRIHWRSTARVGELMVRDDESAWRPHTVLVLDNRAASHTPESYEAALSAVASIALRLGRAGRALEVRTTAGRRLGGGAGESFRTETLLDELALLAPDDETVVHASVRRLRAPVRRGLLVAVTGGPADPAVLTGLAGPDAPVVLVVCGAARTVPGPHLTVVDGRPDTFVAAWNSASIGRRVRVARAPGGAA